MLSLKTRWAILFFWMVNLQSLFGQQINSIESFFADIPILQSSEKWLSFIETEKNMGIDSTKGGFVFSSLKDNNGITGKLFMNATRIRINYNKWKIKTGLQTLLDTVESITVLGVFEYSKEGKKKAKRCLSELMAMLKQYYTKNCNKTTKIKIVMKKKNKIVAIKKK